MVEVVCLIVDGISDVDIRWVDVSVMGRVVKGFLPIVDNIFDDEIYSWIFSFDRKGGETVPLFLLALKPDEN